MFVFAIFSLAVLVADSMIFVDHGADKNWPTFFYI